MVDFNKEIKLSDLFRRGAKEPAEEVAGEEQPPRERRSLFARGEQPAKPPREKKPKAEKQPKEPRRRAKATVLAAKAAPELPPIPLMRAVNLLPKEEDRQKERRAGLAQVAVALLGVLLVAGLAGAYLFTSAGVTSKQSEVDDLRAQLAELEVPAVAPDQGGSALAAEGLARATALSAALSTRLAWDRILRELSLVLPEEAWLVQIAAATPNSSAAAAAPAAAAAGPATGNTLTLTGFAETAEDVAVLLSRLSAIPEFASVQLQSSARSDEDGAPYSFSILVGVDPAGAAAS